ncbi:hypothetical protein TraAM80_08955 [Trypanosoma rangeli]|uniref:MINDY4 N-terminal dimerisation domain-containing protein n=1 Tax=Trypanosoma rangeli TaxID=5698 RepID=A0A3R7M2F1_TRYRA|nr:uncharacterized protein TraAM80_08955 [Trypanosoma rangeli]RNE98111.1 hypothetical protein TraAM80_08955 [Trypanosoma rangeli]|eukprot:RNE98111.1 hypothetical protein TraAM80_08955 [Trypanosoma rangeli]
MTDGEHAKPGAADMDTITALSVREQVEALAQALLREFMHRRGYTKTLQMFDRECPRDARTIASRQLMRQLLEIPAHAFPSRLSAPAEVAVDTDKKDRKKNKHPPPTYMEELCSYRLQKREVQQRWQQAEEQRRTGAEAVLTVKDPSDAEMEEWRGAATERERRIAEAHERIARKQRKRDKLRKKRDKKRQKQSEAEDGCGGMAQVSHAAASHHHGKHHRRPDDISDDDELLHPVGGWARRQNSGSADDGGGVGGGGVLGSAAHGRLAEPEFLFGRLDRQGEGRLTGHAVGSHWAPSSGEMPGSLGSGGGTPFIPDAPAVASSVTGASATTSAASERAPFFLVGEGMSLMSERMQAAKRHNASEDWRLPAPMPLASSSILPASVMREVGATGGGGSRGMRDGAGFVLKSASSARPRHASREISQAGSVLAFPYATAGWQTMSHSPSSHARSLSTSAEETSPVSIPPAPASGILKLSSEPRRGFDGNARPACSAMRKITTSKDALPGNSKDDAAGGETNGNEREQSSGRKKRKVTILVD